VSGLAEASRIRLPGTVLTLVLVSMRYECDEPAVPAFAYAALPFRGSLAASEGRALVSMKRLTPPMDSLVDYRRVYLQYYQALGRSFIRHDCEGPMLGVRDLK
jgi:hypothetical protein